MTATLDIRRVPTDTDRLIVIDCPHGTTTVALLNAAAGGLSETESVLMALSRHDDEEGCGCTRRLWRRYGGRTRSR